MKRYRKTKTLISRRALFSGAASAAFASNLPSGAIAAESGRIKLAAALRLDGKEAVFREADGIDRGVYVGEFVQQRSVEAKNPELPTFTVHFRSDPDNPAREEIVVELGRCWIGKGNANDVMMPYTLTIMRGDSVVNKIDVPYHWWRARWRWQSAPRPVVRGPDVLRQRGWVPPLKHLSFGTPAPSQKSSYDGPMSTGGIETAMSMAGDRKEIGVLTEPQADFLVTGSSAALETVLAWGEACGTMPMHLRDEKTGSQIDLMQYPQIGMYASHPGDPTLPESITPVSKDAHGNWDPRYFMLDSAHTPAAAAMPFMLTDDPYYLEELEAQGQYGIIWSPWDRAFHKVPLLVFPEEDRSTAWSMRNLFQLAVFSPEKPPAWLKPRAYWQKCVDANRAWLEKFMENPARIHRQFRMCPRSDEQETFMRAFLCCAVAQGISMGHKDWLPFFRWIVETHIVMSTGRDGWNRQFPAPYIYYVLKHPDKYPFLTLAADSRFDVATFDAETYANWSAVWDQLVVERLAYLKKNGWEATENWDVKSWDGHTLMNPPQNSPQYHMQLRAALVAAAKLGVTEAQPGLDYLEKEVPPLIERLRTWYGYRWCYSAA